MNKPKALLAICVLAGHGTVVFGLDCNNVVFEAVLDGALLTGLPNAATPGSTVSVQWTTTGGSLEGEGLDVGPNGSWGPFAFGPVKPGSEIRVTGGGGGQSCIFNMPCVPRGEDECAVPTVSEWSLAILTLLGLTVGTIVFASGRFGPTRRKTSIV